MNSSPSPECLAIVDSIYSSFNSVVEKLQKSEEGRAKAEQAYYHETEARKQAENRKEAAEGLVMEIRNNMEKLAKPTNQRIIKDADEENADGDPDDVPFKLKEN